MLNVLKLNSMFHSQNHYGDLYDHLRRYFVHFDNEQNIYTTTKNHEENGYTIDLGFSISTY